MSKYETKYRVIENRHCNDFNDELPYTIITVDYDPKNDLIRTRGFANWGKNKNDLIDDRKEAERVFVHLMCKDLKKELIKECKEHQEAMQIADKRIRELEKQLAEKEKENLALAHIITDWDDYSQEKIDFAIEQLEKVKKFVVRQLFITTKDCSDLDEAEAKGCNELREETIKEIDNQIKQLKEGK